MKSGGDGILSGVVWPVAKLEGVECVCVCGGDWTGGDVLLYQPLKALHHDRGECSDVI